MQITRQTYKATTGYNDVSPGQSGIHFEITKADDVVISVPDGSHSSNYYNEIQTQGDSELRRAMLPDGDDGESILFTDDPNYDKLFFLRQYIASSDLPVDEDLDQDFIRRWVALSTQSEQVIADGDASGVEYFDEGGWGQIESIETKNAMLKHIKHMNNKVKKRFRSIENERQWAAEFVLWRDGLTGRIKFKR